MISLWSEYSGQCKYSKLVMNILEHWMDSMEIALRSSMDFHLNELVIAEQFCSIITYSVNPSMRIQLFNYCVLVDSLGLTKVSL